MVTPPSDRARSQPPAPIDRRLAISGYTTSDGKRHSWRGGTVEPAGRDSLLFIQPSVPARGLTAGTPGGRRVLATSEVMSIQRPDYILGVPLLIGFAVIIIAIVILQPTYWGSTT